MSKALSILLQYISSNYWKIGEFLAIVAILFAIRRFKLTGQHIAIGGFVLLGVSMVFNILQFDDVAGKIAEYVLILFIISCIQEFIHFLKHENV